MTQPSPADELRAAAEKLRTAAAAIEAPGLPSQSWHAEECADNDRSNCACIVVQGKTPTEAGITVPTFYVADAETPEIATYIALMGPDVGHALAKLLDRQGRIAREVQDHLGDEFQDGALDQNVHDALAVARDINGSQP
jgi:hypothetical protein